MTTIPGGGFGIAGAALLVFGAILAFASFRGRPRPVLVEPGLSSTPVPALPIESERRRAGMYVSQRQDLPWGMAREAAPPPPTLPAPDPGGLPAMAPLPPPLMTAMPVPDLPPMPPKPTAPTDIDDILGAMED